MDKERKPVVLTGYYRPAPGGCCKRYFRAINALLYQGHSVHYLSVSPFPIDHPDCHHHRFPWPEKYTDNLLFWGAFYLVSPFVFTYLAVKNGITHCFSFHPAYAFGMQLARFFKRISITVFYRADHILNHEIKGTQPWIIALEKIIEKIAVYDTKIFCVSRSLAEIINKRINLASGMEVQVLPNDVVIKKYVHNREDVLRIAAVGILEERKNLKLLLDLITGFSGRNIRLDIYGTGPHENRLKELAREAIVSGQVKFHGWVDRDEIWPNVDLLLMPSLHEGSPNSVLEALGSDIPVLASAIPEHREILGELQLLDPDHPEAWYLRLNQILDDPGNRLEELVKYQSAYRDALVFNWDEKVVGYITE